MTLAPPGGIARRHRDAARILREVFAGEPHADVAALCAEPMQQNAAEDRLLALKAIGVSSRIPDNAKVEHGAIAAGASGIHRTAMGYIPYVPDVQAAWAKAIKTILGSLGSAKEGAENLCSLARSAVRVVRRTISRRTTTTRTRNRQRRRCGTAAAPKCLGSLRAMTRS